MQDPNYLSELSSVLKRGYGIDLARNLSTVKTDLENKVETAHQTIRKKVEGIKKRNDEIDKQCESLQVLIEQEQSNTEEDSTLTGNLQIEYHKLTEEKNKNETALRELEERKNKIDNSSENIRNNIGSIISLEGDINSKISTIDSKVMAMLDQVNKYIEQDVSYTFKTNENSNSTLGSHGLQGIGGVFSSNRNKVGFCTKVKQFIIGVPLCIAGMLGLSAGITPDQTSFNNNNNFDLNGIHCEQIISKTEFRYESNDSWTDLLQLVRDGCKKNGTNPSDHSEAACEYVAAVTKSNRKKRGEDDSTDDGYIDEAKIVQCLQMTDEEWQSYRTLNTEISDACVIEFEPDGKTVSLGKR